MAAFVDKNYKRTIEITTQIQAIKVPNESQYLKKAKTLETIAKKGLRGEFEPFITSRSDDGAPVRNEKERLRKTKETYTHGYILESMGRKEEALVYFQAAESLSRPGDEYYDRIIAKIKLLSEP